jgi:uncharacterized protein DUF3826
MKLPRLMTDGYWFAGIVLGVAVLGSWACPRKAEGMAPSTAAANPEVEAAYTKVINERADKIVATLGIEDSDKATRVRDLISGYYRSLRDVHDERDAKIAETKQSLAGDKTVAEAWVTVARDRANLKLIDVHRRFVARLAVELSPEQIEKVKDGLTYGVVQVTYQGYLQLLPDLTDEQKREILANLIEAREQAMDGGSSEEKHAIFGKYKGRINNYLSQQGYDLKAAEKERAERKR